MKHSTVITMLVTSTILSGCWGVTELKEISIVSGVGIDVKENGAIEVTTQVIKPASIKKGSPDSIFVRTSTGITTFEAIRDFIITSGKKQNWQHVNVLVIGQEVAKKGVTPILDFFKRDHEPRFLVNVLLSEDKAKDILKIKSKTSPVPTMAMKDSIEEQKFLSKAPTVAFHDFMERLMEPYLDPYLPIIHKAKDDYQIFGTAIFKGDKIVGKLTSLETRGMLRTLGEIKGGLQVIKLSSENKEAVNISIEIKNSTSSITPLFENGKPKMVIEIKETGFIGEISNYVTLNEKKLQEIERLYADAIKKEVEQAVKKIQKEFQANIFNFAGVINRADKGYWKRHRDQWEELYPTIKVVVKVETKIPANGLNNH